MNQGHSPGNKEKAVDRIGRDFREEISRPWQLEIFGVLELDETIGMYIANIYIYIFFILMKRSYYKTVSLVFQKWLE